MSNSHQQNFYYSDIQQSNIRRCNSYQNTYKLGNQNGEQTMALHSFECCSAECRYAGCRGAKMVMLLLLIMGTHSKMDGVHLLLRCTKLACFH
jgi:hypothetical protein